MFSGQIERPSEKLGTRHALAMMFPAGVGLADKGTRSARRWTDPACFGISRSNPVSSMKSVLGMLRLISFAALCLTVPSAFPANTGEDDFPSGDVMTLAIIDQTTALGMAMGDVAAERGQSEAVRSLGRMLSDSHRAVHRQLQDLATRLKIPRLLPNDGVGSYSRTIMDLRDKTAQEFDASFLRQETVVSRNSVDALKSGLGEIKNREVAALAKNVLTEFQHQAEATATAAGKLGIK